MRADVVSWALCIGATTVQFKGCDTVQTWFDKMKEYLKMDEEIPFKEFTEYTQGFIAFLGSELDSLSNEDLLKARFMTSIIQGNASDRGKRKSVESKKYKKIVEKTTLWVDAITLRLVNRGMSGEDIDKATEALSESIDAAELVD